MPARVALVHYWLIGMRGGERVLERLLHLYPEADIFTHVYAPEAVSETIKARKVRTTFIQRLPWAKRFYQKYLPLMPLALEHLDLRGYDLVISSESGPAKGVIASPDALHVCYCHSPMRYLWDHFHDYHENTGAAARAAMPLMFHGLRQWDTASAARVDAIMANSSFIQRRIRKAWGRESSIVHPPVPVSEYAEHHELGSNFLWVGQMTRYKRADLAVEAFNRLGLPLLMVGDGDLAQELRQRAGPNITIKSKLAFAELKRAYATCRALIFTAEEDFGIVPVEANASGRPVIGFGRGGLVDTIIPEETGLFFGEQSVEALVEAVRSFEKWERHFNPQAARTNALRFAPEKFDAGVRATIANAMAQR